jgi:hypothetical protein
MVHENLDLTSDPDPNLDSDPQLDPDPDPEKNPGGITYYFISLGLLLREDSITTYVV